MGEEEDDLLRAAEELGIELSGVRAEGNGKGAADEKEEQVVAEGDGGTDGKGSEKSEAKAEKK
jgi:DNA-directed RNA polymerase subunit beta